MSHPVTDKELVTQAVRGRTDAFGQLVERHIHGAYAIAYARVGNATDAEDAVQEAFLRALEKLRSLRDPAKFGSWLLSIARNEAVRLSTERKRATDDAPATAAVILPDAGSQEMNALVREQVMRLPEQHREILLLHYFTGRSTKEIAELLDLRQGAVLKRLQRAREQLAETILRDLEGTRPSDASFTKQVARITALTTALGVGSMTASAAVTTSVALGTTWKALAAGLSIVAALTGAALFIRTQLDTVEAIEPEPVVAVAEQASTPEPEVEVPALTTPPVDAIQTVTPAPAESSNLIVPAANADPATRTLTGQWRVILQGPQQYAAWVYDVTQNGSQLALTSAKEPINMKGEGTFYGNLARVKIVTDQGIEKGNSTLMVEGTCSANVDTCTLKGQFTTGEFPQTWETPDRPVTEQPRVIPVTTHWTRISSEEITFNDFIEQMTADMKTLRNAIHGYVLKSKQSLPRRLEDLVPAYIGNLDPFSAKAGATLEYRSPPIPRDTGFRYMPDDVIGPDASYHPEMPMSDRLAAYEAELTRLQGDRFWTGPLVVVTYRERGVRAYIGLDLSLSMSLINHGNENEDEATTQLRATQRAGCASNLKQLGAAMIQFMKKVPGGYSPPGWMTLYKIGLADSRLFTCPSAEPGTQSYKFVWPTANNDEFHQLDRDLFGDALHADSRAMYIPVIIETHECSGDGGRCVLFLDGHIEYVPGPLENHPKLAPFLNVR